MKKILTLESYLIENASYTRLENPTKATPYKQFILGMKDNSEIAVNVALYKIVKNYLGGL
jgi:hypothetical protein